MLSVIADKPKPSKKPAVLARDVAQRELVPEDGRFYQVDYQLGPDRAWRESRGSSKWAKRPSKFSGEPELLDPVYETYTVTLPAEEVNGLITTHNEWRAKNIKAQRPAGDVNYMLAILDVQEKKGYRPDEFAALSGVIPETMLRYYIQGVMAESQSKRSNKQDV